MKHAKHLLTFAILSLASSTFASVLDQVAVGDYAVICVQPNEYPVTYTQASIRNRGDLVDVEIKGTAYEGTVSSSVPFEFSKKTTNLTKKHRSSIHDNLVIPGSYELITTERQANDKIASIAETVKRKIGFITTKSQFTLTTLIIENGNPQLRVEDSQTGTMICNLTLK